MQGNKDDFTSTGDEKVTTGCILTIYVKVLLQIQRISDLKTFRICRGVGKIGVTRFSFLGDVRSRVGRTVVATT